MTHKLCVARSTCSLFLLALQGCSSNNNDQQAIEAQSSAKRVTDPQVSASDATTFTSDNEAFALNAYQVMAAQAGNLVFSPTSISLALAMAYAGAAGTTASEMAAALHFTLPPDGLNAAFDAWDLALASRGQGKQGADGGPMRLDIVNAAWAEKTYTFSTDYLDVLATDYGAGIKLLDFVNASASARTAINNWVADQTYQKIQNLLPPGSVDPLTRLVLTNAVYLDAAWLQPFDTTQTGSQSFTRLDNSTVTTMFMGVDLSGVPALQGTGYVAVSLPYQDDNLSMLLVVPDSGTFSSFEASLDAPQLDTIVAGLASQQVVLSMPRFQIETGQDLVALLQSLGMNTAFVRGQADFSGMDGTHNLYISDVIHKAFINVAEKGTEAAAATATVMNTRAVPSGLYVHIDRPFLYFLRDQPTGAILFMGRVVDPSQS
jgi:serpin B